MLLADPLVCSQITWVTSPEELLANARAVEWKLSQDQLRSLNPPSKPNFLLGGISGVLTGILVAHFPELLMATRLG